MSAKKVNPRRRPATVADVEKARKSARDEAVGYALAMFLTVMRDREGYGAQRLKRVWDGIQDLSDSVARGYVNLDDLVTALKDEAGIEIR